jgi:hypothetical protein
MTLVTNQQNPVRRSETLHQQGEMWLSMHKRLIYITLLICVVLCLVAGCSTNDSNRSQHKSIKETKSLDKSTVKAQYGMHYPNLLKKIRLPLGSVTLLAEAKNREDIVAWADSSPITKDARLVSIWTHNPAVEWMVLTYIGSTGAQSWTVHLYANYPVNDKDRTPWKLLYVGSGVVNTQNLYDIESVYIDTDKKLLEFAKRSGEIIETIPITQELDIIKKCK